MNNKKKATLFGVSLVTLATSLSATLINPNVSKSLEALFSSLGDGTWVHYAQAMPGTIEGTDRGVREYWIQCGGGKNSIRFSSPGVSYQEATEYDVSEFESLDPRWIIPVTEGENKFKSVIYSNNDSTLHFSEISGMSSGFTTNDSLPALGEHKAMGQR